MLCIRIYFVLIHIYIYIHLSIHMYYIYFFLIFYSCIFAWKMSSVSYIIQLIYYFRDGDDLHVIQMDFSRTEKT